MKIYLTSDTHLGHDRIVELAHRPADHGERLLAHCRQTLAPGHLFIHLGDVSVGNDDANHRAMLAAAARADRRVLVRGNHDGRSLTWYLARGWDWVCDSMALDIYGARVLLTHAPEPVPDGTVNIHGHLHNGGHHGLAPDDGRHILIALERDGYKVFALDDLLKRLAAPTVARLDAEVLVPA